ncbi:glycoside hydrolase family 3 protein [Actinopolyspora erythraea]|nr:glycoside hydrolase family 3 protein [Actinopolyspora erythraea]
MAATFGRRRLGTIALGTATLGTLAAADGAGERGDRGRVHSARADPVPPPRTTEWALRTLRNMSLRQKVGQLFVTVVYGADADAEHPTNRAEYGVASPAEVVRRYLLGGVIHFSWTDSLHAPGQIAELSNGLQRAASGSGAGIPLTIATDQEQGAVTRIGEPATVLPGNMALGAARDPRLANRAARITGRELRAMGFTQDFAPVGDVNVNPENPVIGVRSFASDPGLAAELTRAQVSGYQWSAAARNTISATAKHFPGHGDTSVDSHTDLPVIDHDERQWRRLDAPPFRAAIDEGVDAVMTGHLKFPGLDPSGEPATLSPRILTGLLRQELGFEGVVVTDSLRMEGVHKLHPTEEIPVLALAAGADQLLMPENLPSAIESVIGAVRSGRLSERDVDRSVLRILSMKDRRGSVSNPLVDPEAVERRIGTPHHRRQALRITDDTVTVLRDDAGTLPLGAAVGSVFVTGWGETTTAALAAELEPLRLRTETLHTGDSPDSEVVIDATERAGRHDVTIVLTNGAWRDSGNAQRELLWALGGSGKPVVAVAVRDPYDAACVDDIQVWLATYSYRKVSMESLARVLFGRVSPTGRLPVPVPEPDRPDRERYRFGHGITW